MTRRDAIILAVSCALVGLTAGLVTHPAKPAEIVLPNAAMMKCHVLSGPITGDGWRRTQMLCGGYEIIISSRPMP